MTRRKPHSGYFDKKTVRKTVLSLVLPCLCILPGISAYGKDLPTVSEELFAMDTYMTVSATGERAKEAVEASLEEIRRLDALWSVGNEDSEISRLNRHERVELSEDTAKLLERASEISFDTENAFDLTVYPLMQAWGFTTGDYRIPEKEEREKLLVHVGAQALEGILDGICQLPENVQIDPGGIAKGYTSDRIMEIFKEYGITGGLVSLGGNVEAYHTKEDGSLWRVGIRNPDDSVPALSASDLLGIVQVSDLAVITSGGYERYFEQDGVIYHHILDPKTGMPADSGLISVTIVSGDGCLADGLSTALFVMGRDKALDYWRAHRDEFDAILVEQDGTVLVTSGIADSFSSDLSFVRVNE